MSRSTSFPPPSDVVIFQPEFGEFGGQERVILSLTRRLDELGRSSTIVCYFDHIGLNRLADHPINIHQIRPQPNPFSKILMLRRTLRSLHIAGNPTPLLVSIQACYHAGLAVASPYHVWIPDTYRLLSGVSPKQDFFSAAKSGLSRSVRHFGTQRGIRRAEGFFTNTRALRDEMRTLYGRDADVIYLGGEGSPLGRAPTRDFNPVRMLSVSRLQASKRIDWVLEGLARERALPAWELHIVGDGPDRERLVKLAQSLCLSERVFFHGFVSDERLDDLYRQTHVFVMPARQGYGLPALEALYRHVAVVMSGESGVIELLRGTPWVSISHGDSVEFGEALCEMLDRVTEPAFFSNALPDLPTEASSMNQLLERLSWLT